MKATEAQADAAHALEDLEPFLKDIIKQLRSGVSKQLAHALVYRFRREVGYVVSDLGFGVPTTDNDRLAEIIMEDSQRD